MKALGSIAVERVMDVLAVLCLLLAGLFMAVSGSRSLPLAMPLRGPGVVLGVAGVLALSAGVGFAFFSDGGGINPFLKGVV